MIQLVCLAAIWGGSFIFMRVLAPVIGPIVTADLRVLIGGTALLIYFGLSKFDPEWKRFWRHYLVIGAVNSAAPFFLYAYAALHLPASYEVILNSSSPLFGAVFSALWLSEKLTPSRVLGLIIGSGGVAFVTGVGAHGFDSQFGLSIAACLSAAACYGLSGVYIKRYAKGAKPKAIAGCSQLLAGLLLLPVIPLAPPKGPFSFSVGANILGLALLCSAVAYLLYYQLVEDTGPTKALTTTFLMPIFGMLWGAIFLGEAITASMLGGCGLILAGTVLVLNIVRFEKSITH